MKKKKKSKICNFEKIKKDKNKIYKKYEQKVLTHIYIYITMILS